MNEPGGTEFDRYAKDYTDLHRTNVRASGEEPSYFSRYKALYMARELGPNLAKRPLSVLDVSGLRAKPTRARPHFV